MLPYQRAEEPECLAKNARAWTEAFVESRKADPKASFSWNSKTCYNAIRDRLFGTTGNRCAFCDGPAGSESRQTVEHFQPKKSFPDLACSWPNLFPCCDACQSSKGEKYDPALIKPDLPGYDPDDYFAVIYKTGELVPSPAASPENQTRASYTIEIYGLNLPVRLENRKRELRHFLKANADGSESPDDYNYRWFLR